MSSSDNDSVDSLSGGNNQKGELESFIGNQKNLASKDKNPYLVMCYEVYLQDFSLDVHPYNHPVFKNKKRERKVTLPMVKKEVKRRNKSFNVSNRRLEDLKQILKTDAFKLNETDLNYLKGKRDEYIKSCEDVIKEDEAQNKTPAKESKAPPITKEDYLRFTEALFSDEAKPKMIGSQDCLSREELDARNSVQQIEDFFETVANVFNNKDFQPNLVSFPAEEHPEFMTARPLPLKDYRSTRSKAKEVHDTLKNKLLPIMGNWEKSGNGSSARSEEAPDYDDGNDEVDLVDGAMKKTFVHPNDYHVLCFWCCLEQEGMLDFTLSKLPRFVASNSHLFALVDGDRNKRSSHNNQDDSRKVLATSLEKMTMALSSHASSTAQRNILAIEDKIYDVDCQLVEYSDQPEDNSHKSLLLRRKRSLEVSLDMARKSARLGER